MHERSALTDWHTDCSPNSCTSNEILVFSESEPPCQLAKEKPCVAGLKPDGVTNRGALTDFLIDWLFAAGFGWERKGVALFNGFALFKGVTLFKGDALLIATAGDDKPSTTAVASNAMRFFMVNPFTLYMLSLTK
jgi:hypothetical protein